MKSIISLALILLVSQMTFAANPSKKAKDSGAKKPRLSTSFKFDGSALRGKYNSSMSTAATVENDKLLDDLLKGRTQFADRLEKETERN
jgi:hypothetical protein